MEDNKKLIEVKDLKVSFFTPVGEVKAVDGINYSLGYNEVMGIVGESGSGKIFPLIFVRILSSPLIFCFGIFKSTGNFFHFCFLINENLDHYLKYT